MSGKLYQLSPNTILAEYSDVSYDLPATAITPTPGAPFVLAACFPIKYTPTGEGASEVTIAATDAGDLTIVWTEIDNVYDIYYNDDHIFFLNSDGKWNAVGDDAVSVTFNGDSPTQDTTQVLGFTPTYALQDRAVNTVTLGSGVESAVFKFPQKQQGKARDFMLRLVITGSDVPEIGFVEPDGTEVAFDADDDSWADIEQGVNLLMFTDTQEASA